MNPSEVIGGHLETGIASVQCRYVEMLVSDSCYNIMGICEQRKAGAALKKKPFLAVPAASGTPTGSDVVWCYGMCASQHEISRGFAGGGTWWSRTSRRVAGDRILTPEA